MMNKEQLDKSLGRFKEMQSKRTVRYEKAKICPRCGEHMRYIFGEMFECPNCKLKEQSDFGKVREFLETYGAQPAIVISESTGVSVDVINDFLKEGRVEIPDGSSVYIQCQGCGVDIRYGRFCPDCMMKMTKNINNAIWTPDVGEKPTKKSDMSGRMHTLTDEKLHKR